MNGKKNAIYAQSGGVTSVINVSACGVIRSYRENIGDSGILYAAHNGILGVLNEEFFDTNCMSDNDLVLLKSTPGGVFGSCRYKLKNLEQNRREYERIIEVFMAYNIGYFFYNGGNDSADTCLKISQIATELGYPIQAIHIPKTIDNDLVATDNCPGFGSVAKYIAVSTYEAGIDLASMYATSTKVFILEVMGRNAGWIASASALAKINGNSSLPPHIILLPEVAFHEDNFIVAVENAVRRYGYCVVVASEGIKDSHNQELSASGSTVTDAFGHQQLGGVAAILANIVKNRTKLKCHYAIADYLQRSARHIASKTDVDQAYKVGYDAVLAALDGYHAVMMCIARSSTYPYRYQITKEDLQNVANYEKFMPYDFIDESNFGVTQKCIDYMLPLIQGEDYPEFVNGVPNYLNKKYELIAKKLPAFSK